MTVVGVAMCDVVCLVLSVEWPRMKMFPGLHSSDTGPGPGLTQPRSQVRGGELTLILSVHFKHN